jgi:hypothetical protein
LRVGGLFPVLSRLGGPGEGQRAAEQAEEQAEDVAQEARVSTAAMVE